jgi:DNA-binding PadR family transcriptional regulator
MAENLSDLGRFADAGLLILTSLAGGQRHGYAIMDDIRAMTGVRLGPGTLYAALARLVRVGYIEPASADDPRRRPYQLTPAGIRVLEQRIAGLQQLATTASERLAAL